MKAICCDVCGAPLNLCSRCRGGTKGAITPKDDTAVETEGENAPVKPSSKMSKAEEKRAYAREYYRKHHAKASKKKSDPDQPMTDDERFDEYVRETGEKPLCQECLDQIPSAKVGKHSGGFWFHRKCFEEG